MKKLLLAILLLLPLSVEAVSLPDTYSDKVLIYNLTDNVVMQSKEADKVTAIASLTKIATTITAIELAEDLDREVIITSKMLSNIQYDASVAGLKVGDKVTIRDLLYASILPSGADATNSLAYSLSGSIESFVNEMNNLAKRLEMKNTNFVNVTGLDINNHYSTANDVLILLKYALQNEKFKEIYTTKEYTLTNGLKVESSVKMYNKMMNLDTSRIIGSKTGFTDDAGLCISALINSNGKEILIITMGADYVYGNFYNLKDALKLIDFIDNSYNNQPLMQENVLIDTLNVTLSKIDTYEIKSKMNITKYLENDYDKNKFQYSYEGLKNLSYKNKVGEKLGTISYYYGEELLATEDVILDKEISIDYIKVINEYKVYIIIAIVIILALVFIKIFNK